jgi:D-glycero-D-manno-heptose 1,7-bisphosphate phosphatase
MQARAIFLDRDDTLIDTSGATADLRVPGDLLMPDRVGLLRGVGPALARLQQAGYALVVVSNQGGVARAMGTIRDLEATNAALRGLLAGFGVKLAGAYACPFAASGHVAPFNTDHPWRKPAPGMYLAAARELGLDVARSWAIGDKPRDLEAAVRAGVPASRCVLLSAGAGPGGGAQAWRVAMDITSAADLVLGQGQG